MSSARAGLGLGIGVLGVTLAARVVWSSADLQLLGAIETANLARHGGVFAASPRTPHASLMFSLVVTALLGVIFSIAAARIDALARRVRDTQMKGIDRENDIEAYVKRRDLIEREVGLDQSMLARFTSALSVSAPLLVGIGSQLFPTT